MGEYRNRTTGEIKTQGELRRDNPNMSMPRVWGDNVCDALNVDPVLAAPKPTEGIGQYQVVARNGAVQDANDNWVQAWEIVNMFSDIEGGQTKAEQETAYQTQLDTDAAERNRNQRNVLLSETDWWAVSDRTMTSDQTAYRKALRDITTHSDWPHLETDDWPTKP
tara:strand:+ start:277 stop:771 length:495 start_codon:yes stop_codon:yes gene_type:complete